MQTHLRPLPRYDEIAVAVRFESPLPLSLLSCRKKARMTKSTVVIQSWLSVEGLASKMRLASKAHRFPWKYDLVHGESVPINGMCLEYLPLREFAKLWLKIWSIDPGADSASHFSNSDDDERYGNVRNEPTWIGTAFDRTIWLDEQTRPFFTRGDARTNDDLEQAGHYLGKIEKP
jgi:hypothetical protein